MFNELFTGKTPDEIRTEYRRAARLYHPDRGGTDEQMAQLNAAYAVAMDSAQKYGRADAGRTQTRTTAQERAAQKPRRQRRQTLYTEKYVNGYEDDILENGGSFWDRFGEKYVYVKADGTTVIFTDTGKTYTDGQRLFTIRHYENMPKKYF